MSEVKSHGSRSVPTSKRLEALLSVLSAVPSPVVRIIDEYCFLSAHALFQSVVLSINPNFDERSIMRRESELSSGQVWDTFPRADATA
jgi:hypothetical protein